MPQVSELLVKVKDAEARVKLSQVDKEVQNLQQRFAKGFTVTTDTKGLDTVVSKFKEIIDGEERLVTLRQKEVETAKAEYDEAGNLIKARETAIQQTKTVSTNYAEIERHNKQILKDTNALADAQRRLANSLTGTIREKYLNGTFSAERATGAQNQYNAFLSRDFDEVQRAQERVLASQSVFSQLSDQTFVAYATGAMSADEANKSLAASTEEVGNKAQKTGGQFTLLNTIIIRLAHTALTALIRAFREALTEMKNVDTQLTTISRITQTNISDLDALKNKAYEVGNQYGVLASDYLSAAAAFTRAGYREQAEDLAELSSKMQIAGQVSAETANQLLIATDKAYGFNGSVTELSAVMDKMTVIDHNYATSVEKIAEGIGLVAPIASQAHMSMDELIAAMGTITAVTQRSGSESARALRALILSIIKDTTTEIDEGVTWTVEEINTLQDALKTYAPTVVAAAEATGTLIDPMEAIAALSKAYEEGLLTEAKLADITSKLGGKLRASQLLSLIQNYSGMYTQMMADMGNAIGAVDKDVDKALQSWEVKLNQLKNTFTKFVQDSLDTNFIKGLIDSVNWLITGFGNLGTVLGVVAGAFVALNITRIVGWFTNLGKSVSALGGGFKNLILVLTNYKTASKAGAVGTKAFNTALEGTSLSASMAQIAITALAAALSIAIIAINKSRQAEEELRQQSIESAKAAAEEARSINDLKNKYDESKKAFEQGTGSREEYESAQDAIIQKLKDEGVWTGIATAGYDTLTEAIEANTKAANENRKAEMLGGIRDAFKELSDPLYGGLIETGTSALPIELRRVLGNWKLSGDSNLPSWVKGFSAYDLAFGDKVSINDFFGEDVEGRAARIFELYDALIKYRSKLYESGQGKTSIFQDVNSAINLLEPNVKSAYSLLDDYLSLLSEDEINKLRGDSLWDYVIDRWEETNKETKDGADNFKESTDDVGDSVDDLTKKLNSATAALDKYKKALEGGDKGDTFKSMADAYKNAVELFNKGLTGSNAYMSAIDLLIGSGFADTYEEAGKLLGNKFIKAMFEGGGEDFGANAANYIRSHLSEFEGVAIREAKDGTFSLIVEDMEAFAKSAQISEDAAVALMQALDAYDSTTLDGTKQTLDEIEDAPEVIEKKVDVDNDELYETQRLVDSLNDAVIKIKVVTENYDGYGRGSSSGGAGGGRFGMPTLSEAEGTPRSKGGATLVNEEGAELIYANGKAWIAGGGKPTITNLPVGAGVFNAKETRSILTRSGIPSYKSGHTLGRDNYMYEPDQSVTSYTAGGIPVNPNNNDNNYNPNKSGGGKKSNLEKILEELAKYIEKILKKAKKALDAQLAAIDEQINALKREHDAAEDKNKLEELQLKILEAEKNLAEAKNERTVRYFNKETGQWEWMADQKAVHEAEKALQEAKDAYDKEVAEQEYQAQIQALEDLKQALQDQYNDLADHWQEIYDALKESEEGDVDYKKLLKKLGLDKDTSSDIQKLIKAILSYEKKMESGSYDVPLNNYDTAQILGYQTRGGSVANTIGQIFGISSSDLNAKGSSMFSTNSSNVIGDTIYYINGLKIGSDMMNKPLSEILSVLSIYAN